MRATFALDLGRRVFCALQKSGSDVRHRAAPRKLVSTRGEIRLVQYTNQTDSATAELVSQKLVSYPPARMFCGPLPNSPQVWWGPGKFALLRIAEYGDFAAARARIRGDHDGGRHYQISGVRKNRALPKSRAKVARKKHALGVISPVEIKG